MMFCVGPIQMAGFGSTVNSPNMLLLACHDQVFTWMFSGRWGHFYGLVGQIWRITSVASLGMARDIFAGSGNLQLCAMDASRLAFFLMTESTCYTGHTRVHGSTRGTRDPRRIGG